MSIMPMKRGTASAVFMACLQCRHASAGTVEEKYLVWRRCARRRQRAGKSDTGWRCRERTRIQCAPGAENARPLR